MGLHRAGFDVEGVDIDSQPEYPFRFHRADVGELSDEFFRRASFIWASPPCQFRTSYARRPDHVKPSPNLIPLTRRLLEMSGKPYIIENIPGVRDELLEPVTLCGSMFKLDVKRHRLFECSFPVLQPECRHDLWTRRFKPATNRKNLRYTVEVGAWRHPLEVQQKAMGIDWMQDLTNLSNAIPPAYSEFLGKQFLNSTSGDPR